MNITTRYNFGDKLFSISSRSLTKWKECSFCGGKCFITGLNSTTTSCPECYGEGGANINLGLSWQVGNILTVGVIRVELRCDHKADTETIFDNYGDQEAKREEKYMCYETGIGSGTLWSVERLWPNKEDAQAECDRLNKGN